MHLAHLRLRDFRNYAGLDENFAPGFHLLIGDNAQGKTNILEAIYLMATLRSFRGVGGAQMARHGANGYFVGGNVVGGKAAGGESGPSPDDAIRREAHVLNTFLARDIKIYWSARDRKVSLDGHAIKKLSDFFGVVRAVVFCTEDLQLIKGNARARRRFMDLLLAQTLPGYLALLQRYMLALRSRNALLKQPHPEPASFESFSSELVKLGTALMAARRELVPQFSLKALPAYRRIANDAEELRLDYQSSVKNDFTVELAQSRSRERTFRATLVGPHRDDLQLTLNGKSAGQFGSEGQKRSLAIALKIAQAEFLAEIHGSNPILLIDDVMGELDEKRRHGFLPLLNAARKSGGQVFMTCTAENWSQELGLELHRWRVSGGNLASQP